MSTIQNKPFSFVSRVPLELRLWWSDIGIDGQDEVKKYLGGLHGLLEIAPRGDIIGVLVTCWDPTHNVFHFSDFELTPTLEEIVGYIGDAELPLRHKNLVAPRIVVVQKFLDTPKISRVVHDSNLAAGFCTFSFLYTRYGHIGGLNNPENKICSKGNRAKWEEHRHFAFMVAFLGLLVFPRKDGNIDIKIAGVVSTLRTQAKCTLVLMIVAEIFRVLTTCRAGKDFFEGCNLLLQMWIIEHLCHRRQFMSYGSAEKTCIEEFYTRIEGLCLPEGVTGWISYFQSFTAGQIEWTLG